MNHTLREKLSVDFIKFLKDNKLELGTDFTIIESIPGINLLGDEPMEWEVVKRRAVTTNFYEVEIETTIQGFISYGRLLERFYGSHKQA